jgi:hypothetical protein
MRGAEDESGSVLSDSCVIPGMLRMLFLAACRT